MFLTLSRGRVQVEGCVFWVDIELRGVFFGMWGFFVENAQAGTATVDSVVQSSSSRSDL